MMVDKNPIIASIVSIGGIVVGAYLLRWAIVGLSKGKVRYRLRGYDRFKSPVNFWFAVIWGLLAGVFFLLGGSLVFYIAVVKALI